MNVNHVDIFMIRQYEIHTPVSLQKLHLRIFQMTGHAQSAD